MIEIRPYASLGTFHNEWLDARYHFSFSDYHDPSRMGLGPLRVINDDKIGAQMGFGMHPHRDMEIITYVREGAISHRDSLGNHGETKAGNVQVMSAGTGITHSEFNAQKEAIRSYQIWIMPRHKGTAPRWETRSFGNDHKGLNVLISGLPEHQGEPGVLAIDADAALYGGTFESGERIARSVQGAAYLLVSAGRLTLNGQKLTAGDAAILRAPESAEVVFEEKGEIVWIDLPTTLN